MSRVFIIGAGFSKAVANAPLADQLFDKIYTVSKNDTNKDNPQWERDYRSFNQVVAYLQKESIAVIDKLLENKDIKIKKAECDQNLYPIHIEYLCTLLDLNIYSPYIPKGIGTDLSGCPITYLNGIYVDHVKDARNFIQHYIVQLLLPHNLKANQKLLQKATSLIHPNDTVITFNYDVLIEQALWERNLWNPLDGYVIGSLVTNEELIGDEIPKTVVPIIKLHGSVNWTKNSGILRNYGIGFYTSNLHNNKSFFRNLKVKANHLPFEYNYPLSSHVVIPSYLKTYQENWEITLVQEALKAIEKTNEIYILGYSLPDADAMANFIFGSIKKDSKIVIVNPGNPMKLRDRLIEKYDLSRKNIIYEESTIEEWITNEFRYVAYEKKQAEIREINELLDYGRNK